MWARFLLKMRTFKLTIEYDGTDFQGWQIQAKGERTVQAEIEKVLLKIFQTPIKIHGSGRTDTGVHAQGQVAHCHIKTDKSCEELTRALNGNLERDISILSIEDVPSDFHARFSVKSKTYRYSIINQPVRSALYRHYCLQFSQKLNIKRMKEEALSLIGEYDFRSFQASDPARKDRETIRTIHRIDIKKTNNLITIDIEANGFLYKMVRNIVGTLLDIGTGKLPAGSMKRIRQERNRIKAGDTAKPHGLCLLEVNY